jgi:putative flippase GtrA
VIDLWTRLRRSPLGGRVTRYTIGSVIAAVTSAVVFALVFMLGASTTVCSTVAFIAGAIPNWVLNRRWAWRVTGRVALGREVLAYIVISVLSLLASSLATSWAHGQARSITDDHATQAILVSAAYVAVFAILFVGKFVVYEVWVFSGRSRIRAALRSRRQVWIAARANRIP